MTLNFALFFFLLIQSSAFAQFYFLRYDSVEVTEENGRLEYPWAGGLNHPQFSNIDFNLDGRNDLFVFDKSGNKTVCFTSDINNDLHLAPGFRPMFVNQHNPYKERLHDWVLLRDFDNDGRMDIFTYSNGGMAVYRNDGNADTLIFTLMTPKLLSDYGNGLINIYVSPIDLPAIMDVDGDNDMDIVVFSLFGTSAEYHRNLSMETYGHADSLIFELSNPCWGDFEEDPAAVGVNLNVSCKGGNGAGLAEAETSAAHSGFTMLGLDIEGDGDQDLVLSNVNFNTMNILINDGTPTDAHIGSQDFTFPANFSDTDPIDLYTFPAAFLADVNNDGRKDLLASSYQESNGDDHEGILLYMNTGSANGYSFDLVQNNFLQKNMIELGTGAYPVFFDYDRDGLADLIAGNKGYFVNAGTYSSQLAYYRNTGTATEPAFTLQTRDLSGISQLGLSNIAPTFGDVDGDGDEDMIIGDASGLVHYFENSAGPGNPCSFSLTAPGYQGIDIAGQFATPFLYDVDGDNVIDMVIGERSGNLNYYHNDGTADSPTFVLEDDNFGGVNMRSEGLSYGYSSPFLFEHDNELQMLVGSESGRIDLYTRITETMSGPEQLTADIGDGTALSTGTETTPFGFSASSGRNQYLIRAEELTDAGLTQGVIENLSLFTENGPSVTHAQFYIKMGLTDLGGLNGFVENVTTVYFVPTGSVPQGTVDFEMQTPIIWDGQSNLIVEFCWFQTEGNGTDLNVEYSTTSFQSNAYSSTGNFSGCGIPYQASDSSRPNITLAIKPSFHKVGEFPVYEGERSTVFGSDMNDDGMPDFVIGNLAGGLAYYKGGATGLVIDNIGDGGRIHRSDLSVYPNPNNGTFIIEPDIPMAGDVELRVYDMLGKEVWQSHEKNLILSTVSLSALKDGIYLLNARSADKVAFKRFIIQK